MGHVRLLNIGLLVASSCSAALAQNALDEDLKHSQVCSKAARDFQGQPEWKDHDLSFTSHFNKRLGKCLVKVSGASVVEKRGEVLETEHVYDALENTVLGGKITRKALPRSLTGEQKTLGIVMILDGKILGKDDVDAAGEAFQWFGTLMTD